MLKLANVHPGEVLSEEYMKPFGISSRSLARAMGLSRRTVREIVQGRRAVSADVALRLAEVLGTPARFWLGLQCDYDLEAALQGSLPPT